MRLGASAPAPLQCAGSHAAIRRPSGARPVRPPHEENSMTAYKMRLRRKKAKQTQKKIKEKAKARKKAGQKRR
jgi:hypothetical protein